MAAGRYLGVNHLISIENLTWGRSEYITGGGRRSLFDPIVCRVPMCG
jgi:hypothetical protein